MRSQLSLPARIAGIVAALLVAMLPQAAAQSMPGGGSGGSDTRRPGPVSDVLDAIEGGSRWLIRRMQPGEERDLVTNPRFDSTKSPRDSMMTFLEAMALVDRGYSDIGYARALRTLPAGADRSDADRLQDVLLRVGPISAASLPGAKEITTAGDTRYQFFPRGTDHQWVWEAAKTPPSGEISLVKTAENRWQFSPPTLDDVPGLGEALADLPPRYVQAGATSGAFVSVFAPIVEQTSLFAFLAFVGLTAAGVAAGLLFAKLVGRASDVARDKEHDFLASTLQGFGRSGGLVLFTIVFTIALGFIELGPVLRALRFEIPRFLLVIAIALFVLSGIDVLAASFKRRIEKRGSGHYDHMVVTIVRRVLRVVVGTIIILFLLQNVLGLNIGALVLGFGVIGLALSLAAQDTMKNLFGAISIFINKPFVIGDWIVFTGEMGTHTGQVKDIELQSTKVQVMEGDFVTIPNMMFISREVQNLSARGYIRREVNIAIPYRSDAVELERAMTAMMDVFEDEEVREDANYGDRTETPHVSFSSFESGWLNLKGYHFYFMGGEPEAIQRDEERGWFTYLGHCSLVNRKLVKVFGERDIEFAFPTQTIDFRTSGPVPVVLDERT